MRASPEQAIKYRCIAIRMNGRVAVHLEEPDARVLGDDAIKSEERVGADRFRDSLMQDRAGVLELALHVGAAEALQGVVVEPAALEPG